MANPTHLSDHDLTEYIKAYNRSEAFLTQCLGHSRFDGKIRINRDVAPWITRPITEYPGLGLEFLDEDGMSAKDKWDLVMSTVIRYHDEQNNERVNVLPFVLIGHRQQYEWSMKSFTSLLEMPGFDPNMRCGLGMNLLQHCAMNNSPEYAKILLEAGADPRLRAKKGISAIKLAENMGHAAVHAVMAAWVAQKAVESVTKNASTKKKPT